MNESSPMSENRLSNASSLRLLNSSQLMPEDRAAALRRLSSTREHKVLCIAR